MKQSTLNKRTAEYMKNHRRKRKWTQAVICLAAVVVFCTTYALILPAVTMEKEPCRIPEHTHSEACYTQVTSVTKTEPLCTIESRNLYQNTDSFLNENGESVRGYADFVVHGHDASCYDEDGNLWCPLPEIKVHAHDEGCYAAAEAGLVHTHDEDCYMPVRGELICAEEEKEGHTHSAEAGCFDENGELICQTEESSGHQHTDDCYAWEQALVCELSTEPEQANEPELVCGKEEIIPHEHSSGCFGENGELICGRQQVLEHVHNQDCFQTAEEPADKEILTCRLEENGEHQHGPLCYGAWKLTCGLEEHIHTEECNISVELTEEEQAQVEEVIALIDTLPTQQEIEETLTGFEDHGDEESYDAYLTEIVAQTKAAYEVYSALTKAQQQKVTNAAKLMALEPLWSVEPLPEENSGSTDPIRLFQYAETNGGEVVITVSNKGVEIQPGESGAYDVTAGETYTVRVAYKGNKLEKGKYYVTFASNIDLEQRGELTLTDNQGATVDVGAWYFEKEDGTVWLIFDITGDLSNHSGITLVADVVCQFGYTDQPIEFDGNIKVNVHHNEDSPDTEVGKWAKNLETDKNEKPYYIEDGKIQWRSEIYGNSGSQILGSKITDTITTPDTHHFTRSDMDNGIIFEATKYETEGSFTPDNRGDSHYWTVKSGDPGITWTETQWTYTMPREIVCTKCGETITLGNDDWLYYLQYTSTVKEDLPGGINKFENKIACDSDEAHYSFYTGTTNLTAQVVKTGKYVKGSLPGQDSDENLYANDTVEWTITVDIPAAQGGEKFDYFWYLMDSLLVEEGNKEIYQDNPMVNMQVTATIDDKTTSVPQYGTSKAENAPLCWRLPPAEEDKNQEIDFCTQCKCTADNCQKWTGHDCESKMEKGGFCKCWSFEKDVRFTITYSTPVGDLPVAYGGKGAQLVNKAKLYNKEIVGGKETRISRGNDQGEVPIPGIFTKNLTGNPEENGLIATYTITVNEAMADLGSLQELTITDTMTPTLSLMPASLKIQYEDEQGTKADLPKEKYTVSPVKEVETDGGKRNVFTITLHADALGPYKYTLTYNASVSGNNDVELKYQNNASVALSGKDYTVTGDIIEVPQAAIGARTYAATLLKMDADRSKRLGLNDAVFELYTYVENGEDVWMHDYTTSDHTDSNGVTNSGIAQIETLPAEGVILHSHTLYYVKEKTAPKGYQLDDTPHYFWFCNDTDKDKKCDFEAKYSAYNAVCIYSGTDADTIDLIISNEAIPNGHELPETGGHGTAPYTAGGLLLTGTGLLLLYHRKKRRKGDTVSS